MLHPTRPTTLGSLFLGALLSACTYSSSDGMTIFSEDGSTYAKSVWQNGNLSMTLTKDGETTIYRVLGELTPGIEMRSLSWMGPDSELTIRQTSNGLERSLLASPDTDGKPLLVYREAGAVATFEIEDQAWYADRLADLYGNSNVGAENYAAAVMEAEGVEGLIARAGAFESSERAEACLRVAFNAPDITEEQCLEITDTIWNIAYESSRVAMLGELSGRHQDNSDLTAALIEGLGDFSSSSHLQEAVLALAGRDLSRANLIGLLEAAQDISFDSNRKETLIALAPLHRLEGDWTRQLVEAAEDLDYSSSVQEAIESFSKLDIATDADWTLLVKATEEIDFDSNRAEALEALIARMPDSDGTIFAVTDTLDSFGSSSSQEDVIGALAKRQSMSTAAWVSVADACTEIDFDSTRSDSLLEVLAAAPVNISVHMAVLDAATSINSSSDLADVLLALTPYCAAEPGLGVAIAGATDQISYESNRVDVLKALVDHCPKEPRDADLQLAACVKATKSMGASNHKEAVLGRIMAEPRLGRPVLKAITKALEDVNYESARARLQGQLIEHLARDEK